MARIKFFVSSSYLLSYGLWRNVTNKYLGMKFSDLKGRIHYGWARLSVSTSFHFTATLTGYAYETIPGKPIKAGRTKGQVKDVDTSPDSAGPGDPGTGASLTTPIPNIPQPASLGLLALGAPAVPLWRRKEAVGGTAENN